MDRNSLLAFLLIAVIIFLMPEYYKLVYPPPPPTDSLIVVNERQIKAVMPPIDKTTPPPSYDKPEEGASTFSVITNLYNHIIIECLLAHLLTVYYINILIVYNIMASAMAPASAASLLSAASVGGYI